MILYGNLPSVIEAAGAAKTALDVGGWFQPLNAATHVLDINPYETRRANDALDPQNVERFARETWTVHDACKAPWPFPDKFFDFSFCSHLLEDVRDPLIVCAELQRVSRSGYIETPSRLREIFAKERFFAVKRAFGRPPAIGFPHHRWFVEIDGTHVMFTAKDHRIVMGHEFYLTRGDLGRKLTEAESGAGLFWREDFTFEEVPIRDDHELSGFRQQALNRARRRTA